MKQTEDQVYVANLATCIKTLRGVFVALDGGLLVFAAGVSADQRMEVSRELEIARLAVADIYASLGMDLDMHSMHFLPESAIETPPKEAA